jgi:membrane protein implicated in regulation of membrane protease activity
VLAFYGVGALIAALVVSLALALASWLACLIVAVVLLALGGASALVGRRRLSAAGSPLPTETIDSTKHDVDEIKRGLRR